MVSCVGRDDLGQRALVALQQRGVNTDCVAVTAEFPTGVVDVQLDAAGKPHFTIGEPAAWDHLTWSDRLEELAQRTRAVCFGTLGQRHTASRSVIQRFVAATDATALRVCDVNLRPPFVDAGVLRRSLELANVLKLSDDELDRVAAICNCAGAEAEVLAQLRDRWDLQLVAITRGSQGATLLGREERSDCAGIPVTVKDSVGAGDAFTAALICGLQNNQPLDQINRHACRVASYVCTQSGATPLLPDELRSV